MTDKKDQLIKNIPFSETVNIIDLVDYEEGRVVSRTLAAKPHVNITLFAFDQGEEISAHTSPGDAMVQILDGEGLITIDGTEIKAQAGQVVVMPANVPHSVFAATRFKMLLTVVKQPVKIQGM
jgi:quercetin dioxygenase-like cupin family protein